MGIFGQQPAGKSVVIRVNYGHNENTQLAFSIAQLAQDRGLEIAFCSTEERFSAVDDWWDRFALTRWITRREGCLSGCTDVVWIEYCQEEARIAKKRGIRSHAVLMPFSKIQAINASRDCYDNVITMTTEDSRRCPTKNILIPASRPRTGFSAGDVPLIDRTLWMFNGPTSKRIGTEILHTATLILEYNPSLRMTLCMNGGWDAVVAKKIMGAKEKFQDRLDFIRNPTTQMREEAMHTHTSMVLLSCYAFTGLRLLEALDAGLPTAVLDYGANSEIIHECPGGVWAIPTRTEFCGSGDLVASVEFSKLLDTLMEFYSGLRAGNARRYDVSGYLERRHTRFTQEWQRLFGIS